MIFSRQIEQFIAVARAGSYIRAADIAALTPSALSHGIHELEHRLGKKLIIRKKSGLVLTRAGEELYLGISPLHDEAANVLRRAKGKCKEITICSDGFFYPTLQKKLHALSDKFKSDVSIQYCVSDDVLGAIIDEKHDIALGVLGDLEDQTCRGICRITLPSENVGILVCDDIMKRYSDVTKMIQSECFYQRSTIFQHPVFKDIRGFINDNYLDSKFVGLPDIADVWATLMQGGGICLTSQNISQHPTVASMGLHFINQPFPFKFMIHRVIYFKDSRKSELLKYISCLSCS